MKFSNLKIGQKFFYKGVELEKCGPLQAMEKNSGTERMIMRSASVELVVDTPSTQSSNTECLDELRQLLAAYHQICLSSPKATAAEEKSMQAAYQKVQQSVEHLAQLIERAEHS